MAHILRTRLDWAEAIRELSDEIHPEAEKIIVVLNYLKVLSRQCLNRRKPDELTLSRDV